ncbi:MAG TPA: hypothetical protein VMV27_01955 [Candidatus Binataceae bacterium]|nr:hypothetical protein [Candidatus Binataceae bacterium]
MAEGFDFEQKQKEDARWRILRVIDAGRPIAVSEQIVWRVLVDLKLLFSLHDVRRELDYLRMRKLIEIEGEETDFWYGTLTRAGIDLVEYTAPVEPGIARPRR